MIYLDNAATTPPDGAAFDRAAAYVRENFYNPSAPYGGGVRVGAEIARARASVLEKIADPASFELIFTSGGTEADDHALFACAKRGNVVITAGEHAAVERTASELKNRGTEVRVVSVRKDGGVRAEDVTALVDEKTSLVSVMHVNNETGAINDIAEIARAVKAKNPRTVFMSDGVQAFGKLPFRLTQHIDLYTASAHKIGGMKGTGALFKRKALSLSPFIFGGGQENSLRSGTENVFGILDFAYAADNRFAKIKENYARLAALKEKVASALDREIFVPLSPENGSPYILSASAVGVRGEVLVRMLWDRGVAVGTGSACSSKHRFSRVLAACGYPEQVLDGVLRLSFSAETVEEDALKAAAIVNETARSFMEKI